MKFPHDAITSGQVKVLSNTLSKVRLTCNLIKGVRVMVVNATFNNISVISWWSVLLVEETEVPRENHQPVASH
jgi:hypothetical protein